MTALVHHALTLPSPEATESLAAAFAPILRAGDVLLLSGEIGAGKTHFARALIGARLQAAGRAEDIPSPTYTLVQIYDDGLCELWHADLYRLCDSTEIPELGLTDAFDTGICLVEWPDRLEDYRPENALLLRFGPGENESARRLKVAGSAACWQDRLTIVFDALGLPEPKTR